VSNVRAGLWTCRSMDSSRLAKPGMYRAARMHQSRERHSTLTGCSSVCLAQASGRTGNSTGLGCAEGAQLRVSMRRISVVRDAAGRSGGPRWLSRAVKLRGLMRAAPARRIRGQISGATTRAAVTAFSHGIGGREDQDDEVQCGGGYGKQPTVAPSWRQSLQKADAGC
jgi:hypothetical protein